MSKRARLEARLEEQKNKRKRDKTVRLVYTDKDTDEILATVGADDAAIEIIVRI